MKIPSFLLENPLQYCCLTEPLRLGRAQLAEACNSGALVYDPDARLHLIAAKDEKTAAALLSRVKNPVFLMICDGEFARLADDLPFQYSMNCLQAVYRRPDPPDPDVRLNIAPPDAAQLACIIENYTMDSPDELRRRAEKGELFFATDKNGADVGFVGLHPEGCFGVLKVLEAQRGKGYGAALEGFIIRFCLQTGRLPYCQVDVNNKISLALQQKLGLEFSSKPMKMLWNDF